MKYRICLLLLASLHAPAWAADKETIRLINDMQAEARAQEGRIARLEAALQKNEQIFNLLKEVDTLKAEIAKLRGDAEVQAHLIETLEKRQKDLYVDLDQRVTELNKAATAAGASCPGRITGLGMSTPCFMSKSYATPTCQVPRMHKEADSGRMQI